MSTSINEVSRRNFIKLVSFLPLALLIKYSNASACPFCLLIDVAITWAERGLIMEALATNTVRAAVVNGLEKSVMKSAFSDISKQRIVSHIRKTDKATEAYDIINRLDVFAENNPKAMELYNKYENTIEALWVTNSFNEIVINIENTEEFIIDDRISIMIKDKETGIIENELNSFIKAEPHTKQSIKLYVKDLQSIGVKDIYVVIKNSSIEPLIKTIFVV